MRRYYLLIFCLLLAAILAGAYIRNSNFSEGRLGGLGESPDLDPGIEQAGASESDDGLVLGQGAEALRTAMQQSASLFPVFHDTQGRPVEGVVVDHAVYSKPLLYGSQARKDGDAVPPQLEMHSAVSGESGRVECPTCSGAQSAIGTKIVGSASKVGFITRFFQHSSSVGVVQTIELHPHQGMKVVLRDKSGVADLGDWAVTLLPKAGELTLNSAEFELERLREQYTVRDRSNQLGEVLFPFVDGALTIQAGRVGEKGIMWTGPARDTIVLDLEPEISLNGFVKLEPNSTLDARDVEIRVRMLGGKYSELSYSYSVEPDLSWRVHIPELSANGDLVVEAFAPNYFGHEVAVPSQVRASRDLCELVLRPGHAQWVFVCDENEKLVEGAVAQAKWEGAFGAGREFQLVRDNGYAKFPSLPPGIVHLHAIAPGYSENSTPIALPLPEPATFILALSPSCSLRGICTKDGDPVRDYRLLIWQGVGIEPQLVRRVSSSDGRFDIAGLPEGNLQIVAEDHSGRASEVATVFLSKDNPGSLDLELQGVRTVSGKVRVVGQDSHSGIAMVRACFGHKGFGRAVESDLQGNFRIELPLSASEVFVSAREMQGQRILLPKGGGADVDLGEIWLGLPKSVGVALRPPANVLCAEFQVGVVPSNWEPIWIDENCNGELNWVEKGSHWVVLSGPNGQSWTKLVRVGIAKHHTVEFDLSSGASAVVILSPAVLNMLTPGCTMEVSYDENKRMKRHGSGTGVAADSFPLTLEHLSPGLATVKLMAGSGSTISKAIVRLVAGQTAQVELLAPVVQCSVEVAGPGGEAIPGARAWVLEGDFGSRRYEVDESSVLTFDSGNNPSHKIWIYKKGIGSSWHEEVYCDKSGSIKPEKLRMTCDAVLRIRYVDKMGPLTGQTCRLTGPQFSEPLSPDQHTDASGLVEFRGLSSATYQVNVNIEGHWPYHQIYDASLEGEVIEVTVPRIGSLVVEVEDAQGREVVGRAISIWTQEFEKDIKLWQDAGALDVVPADWRTDAEGKVSFPVMPEGPFLVSVLDGDGEKVEVPLELLPGEENVVRVVVPD